MVFIPAIGIHEYCHAKFADLAGDMTPRSQGRVTLNPFAHLDPLGTIMVIISSMAGFGIGWASMMGIPYLMVVNDIPKERYGVYMGIINMMIVIPMFIQTVSFGYIMKHFLNNDARNAITFAGVLLIFSAICTLFISTKKQSDLPNS